MSLKAGIVGLPNVGKSTLFKAITKKDVLAANYPFATIEPNVGVVTVLDERVDFLKNLVQPEKTIYPTLEFIDIAGLVAGASQGEGLGNRFLANIREVDVICEVVRCFTDQQIIHTSGQVNPLHDIEIIQTELILADLEIVNNRLSKILKKPEDQEEVRLLQKIKDNLEQGISLRNINLSEEEKTQIKHFNFLTLKKVVFVCNVDEEALFEQSQNVAEVQAYAEKENAEVIILCAKLEVELSEISDNETLLEDLGLNESGLDKLTKKVYQLLDLQTFFTVGKQEVRAWPFKRGLTAPECAGIIHSDFQKGFIKAEVISYQDFKKYQSEKAVQEAGKKRLEGKEYIVQDGDICHFRFN